MEPGKCAQHRAPPSPGGSSDAGRQGVPGATLPASGAHRATPRPGSETTRWFAGAPDARLDLRRSGSRQCRRQRVVPGRLFPAQQDGDRGVLAGAQRPGTHAGRAAPVARRVTKIFPSRLALPMVAMYLSGECAASASADAPQKSLACSQRCAGIAIEDRGHCPCPDRMRAAEPAWMDAAPLPPLRPSPREPGIHRAVASQARAPAGTGAPAGMRTARRR